MKEKSQQAKTDNLHGVHVVLGVTGCIAAYKSCAVLSILNKLGAEVKVIMTKNAENFVGKLTFETLSHNPVCDDTFVRAGKYEVEHVSLAKWADIFLIAPATANTIGKMANGIADDMLSTTVMATTAPVLVCPAMNTNMYNNPATQDNIKTLISRGVHVMEPDSGMLACGDVGAGRFPEPEKVVERVIEVLRPNRDYSDKTVLITAGGTSEAIDPVRSITNRSSGKMGVAIASAVLKRGGRVIFVCGNVSVEPPKGVTLVKVTTTEEMKKAVEEYFEECDALIMAAAPGDYRVANVSPSKIKDQKITLDLVKNPDIAAGIGKIKGNKKLVVFAAETEDGIANAKKKLISKNADFVVLNDVTREGAGFGTDTNIVTLLDADTVTPYEMMSKSQVAEIILDKLIK